MIIIRISNRDLLPHIIRGHFTHAKHFAHNCCLATRASVHLLSEEIFQTLTTLIYMLAIIHVEKQVFRWKFW